MKNKIRIFAVISFASLAALTFTSCGGKRESVKQEALPEKFDKTANITLDEKEYSADFKRGGADIWECEFTAPETIEGLKLTISGEVCRLEYKGLDYTVQRENMPDYGILPLVTKSVDSLIAGRDISTVKSGKSVISSGTVSGESFSAEISDGEIKTLNIEGYLSVEFT